MDARIIFTMVSAAGLTAACTLPDTRTAGAVDYQEGYAPQRSDEVYVTDSGEPYDTGGTSYAPDLGPGVTSTAAAAFTEPPPLVQVEPDYYVVEDYDQPVYYAGGAYWLDEGGSWYRADDWDAPWVVVAGGYVPDHIRGIDRDRYRHYHHREGEHVWREPEREHRGDHEHGGGDRGRQEHRDRGEPRRAAPEVTRPVPVPVERARPPERREARPPERREARPPSTRATRTAPAERRRDREATPPPARPAPRPAPIPVERRAPERTKPAPAPRAPSRTREPAPRREAPPVVPVPVPVHPPRVTPLPRAPLPAPAPAQPPPAKPPASHGGGHHRTR